MYDEWLDEGFARPGARQTRETFEIAANCGVVGADDRDAMLDEMKAGLAFYMGGMGAKEMNFHKNVFARMGYAKRPARSKTPSSPASGSRRWRRCRARPSPTSISWVRWRASATS